MDQPLFHTWHDGLLAIMALGGVFVGVALGAQQLLILGGERFVHQGALALKACEAVLVPVAVLIGQVLFKITHTHTRGTVRNRAYASWPVYYCTRWRKNVMCVCALTLVLQPMGFLHSSQELEYRLS